MTLACKHDPLIGSLLEGRYRIVGTLGSGGMGRVYVAEDARLGRRYALKVLNPELAQDRVFVDRFLREAQTVARLRHPNIVDIHSFGEEPNGVVFFTMELLVGEDLEARIRARPERPYSLQDVCRWSIQIARAVEAVHDAGLIHRDLKTQNIFLARGRDGGEIIKLLDFGIARPEEGSELTGTGISLGTPGYMSPDQLLNEPLDRRSDIYSFGVLLFKLLTGRLPFLGDAMQSGMQHLTAPIPRPSAVAPEAGIPPGFDALIVTAMAKRREDRPAFMGEVLHELLALQEDDVTTLMSMPSQRVNRARATRISARPAGARPATRDTMRPEITAAVIAGSGTEPGITLSPNATPTSDPPSVGTKWLVRAGALLAGITCVVLLASSLVPGEYDMPVVAAEVTPAIDATPEPDPGTLADPTRAPPPVIPAEPPQRAQLRPLEPNAQNIAVKPSRSPAPHAEAPKPRQKTTPKPDTRAPVDPMIGIKERAQVCRKKHLAVSGPKITIEYAIGSDGKVMRATAASETPLSTCLVDAVKQARLEPGIRLRQRLPL